MLKIRGTFPTSCFVSIAALLSPAFGQLPASYSFILYDVPGAISTQINSINVRGDLTGTYTTEDSVSHGFVRLAASPGITTFASPDGKAASRPIINADGQIAFTVGTPGVPGGFFGSTGGFTEIYLRSADGGQYTKLAEFSDADAVVTGMNRLAQLIGYASRFALESAILLNPDGSKPAIRLFGGRNYGINDAGQMMRVNSQSSNIALLLDNPDGTPSGKRLDVPFNPGNAAMSNSGLVAGTFYNSNFGEGFIGDLGTNQYVKLSVPGYEGLTRVNGVNDFGVVVGAVGLTNSPLSRSHGFIATPTVGRPTLMASGIANAAS